MPVDIIISAEDRMLAAIARSLLRIFGDNKYNLLEKPLVTSGVSEFDRRIGGWNEAAASAFAPAHLALRDMDSLAHPEEQGECPGAKINALLNHKRKHPRLLLRLAVAMSENWLIADDENLRKFLCCKSKKPVTNPDAVRKPKAVIFEMAKKSTSRKIRKGVPPQTELSRCGPLYNDVMCKFIRDAWRPEVAKERSKSLRRAYERLKNFSPS